MGSLFLFFHYTAFRFIRNRTTNSPFSCLKNAIKTIWTLFVSPSHRNLLQISSACFSFGCLFIFHILTLLWSNTTVKLLSVHNEEPWLTTLVIGKVKRLCTYMLYSIWKSKQVGYKGGSNTIVNIVLRDEKKCCREKEWMINFLLTFDWTLCGIFCILYMK